MFLLFLLFSFITSRRINIDLTSLKFETNRRFYLATLDANFNGNLTGQTCDYKKNCTTSVCNILHNQRLGVMIIPTPLSEVIACSFIHDNRKVNIVSFVSSYLNMTLNTPIICSSSISQAFADSCDNYDSTKNRFAMIYFGYCE